MIYVGIDPGKQGAIAVLDEAGNVLRVDKMPGTLEDLNHLFLLIYNTYRFDHGFKVALELVRSSPQMGVTSAFTFGRGLGNLEALLMAHGFPCEEVHPVKWQNALDCRTRGDKHVTQALAARLFPKLTVTLAIADALLLAEYLRRRDCGVGTLLETSAAEQDSNNGEESKGVEVKDAIQRSAQGREKGQQAGDVAQTAEARAAAAGTQRHRRAPHQAPRSRVRRDR